MSKRAGEKMARVRDARSVDQQPDRALPCSAPSCLPFLVPCEGQEAAKRDGTYRRPSFLSLRPACTRTRERPSWDRPRPERGTTGSEPAPCARTSPGWEGGPSAESDGRRARCRPDAYLTVSSSVPLAWPTAEMRSSSARIWRVDPRRPWSGASAASLEAGKAKG